MPPHLILIEPISSQETDTVLTPDTSDQVYVQSGWVKEIGELEENISVGDLVIFVGWKERNIEMTQYMGWSDDLYTLHEDDVEAVLEDW